MTVGITIGGWLVDRFAPRPVRVGLLATQARLLLVAVFAMHPQAAAPVMVFAIGGVGLAFSRPCRAL